MAITSVKNLKEFSTVNERFEGAHLLCPGCAHSMIVRELMNCSDDNLLSHQIQDVWKFQQQFIHILHGILHGFISVLKMQQQRLVVLKRCLKLEKEKEP